METVCYKKAKNEVISLLDMVFNQISIDEWYGDEPKFTPEGVVNKLFKILEDNRVLINR